MRRNPWQLHPIDHCWCGQTARLQLVHKKTGEVGARVCSEPHGDYAIRWRIRDDEGEQGLLLEQEGET